MTPSPLSTALAHFLVLSAIGFVGAVIAAIARAQTPDGMARLRTERPRVAAILTLTNTLGINPILLLEGVEVAVTGAEPKVAIMIRLVLAKLAGPGPAALLVVMVMGASSWSCSPAISPGTRAAELRAGVVLVATAVASADQSCATAATSLAATQPAQGDKLAHDCSTEAHAATAELLAAEAALDGYTDAVDGQIACAIARGAVAINAIDAGLAILGVKVPATATQAITFVGTLDSLACPASSPSSDAGGAG